MATNLVQEKVNILRNQISQGELELFNNLLIVNDAKVSTGDEKVDNDFKNKAVQAAFNIAHWEHKLKSRRAMLAELEPQLASKAAPIATQPQST